MTENNINEQSDTTKTFTAHGRRIGNRNDIIGRTQLSLSSFWGLEPTSSKKQESEPGIAQVKDEVDVSTQITAPLPQQRLRLPRVLPTTEKTYAHDIHFVTTETALAIINAPPLKETDPKLSTSLQPKQSKADKTHSFFTNIRTLYLITFIVIFCVIVSGILAYNAMGASKNVSPGKYSHPNKDGSSSMNKQMLPSPMQTTQQVEGDIVPSGIKSLQVGVAPLVTIQEYGGNVTIHAGGAGTMLINGTEEQKAAAIRVTQARGQQGRDAITITPEPISKHVNYDITVPESTQVQIVIAAGSISIDGVNQVSIDTTSGSLVVKNVSGPVRMHTQNGDITAQDIIGSMDMMTINGSIRADTIQGQLKATTQNGDIILRQATLSGQSSMKTKYGSVRFTGTFDPRGKYTLVTKIGDVELTLPTNTAFQLYANTRSGTVSNEFGNNTIGDAPYAQIIASTEGGSVRVNKG